MMKEIIILQRTKSDVCTCKCTLHFTDKYAFISTENTIFFVIYLLVLQNIANSVPFNQQQKHIHHNHRIE